MRLTFCLRNTKTKKSTPIYAFIHWTHDGRHHQWKLTTGERVLPSHWSQKRRRVKQGATGEATTNARLGQIEANVNRVFAELDVIGTEATAEAVRSHYDTLHGKPRPVKTLDIFDCYEQYIDGNATFTEGTRKSHRSARNILKTFAKTCAPALTFDRLDVPMWERFVHYLLTDRKITNVSAWSVVKSVKAFVGASYDKGLHRNEAYRKATRGRLLPRTDSSDQVYLTPDELERVRLRDLSDNGRLARVRDLFVFLAHTGLRFGDAQRIEAHHRHGDTLKFMTGKNRKAVTVPLHPIAGAILDQYEGTLPRISNQKANDYLTEVLEDAGISQPIETVRYRGTERITETNPKHDIVGMHGAKRTFVTLSLLRGASPEALAKVTGNTAATLRVYDVRTSEDAIDEVREAWQ